MLKLDLAPSPNGYLHIGGFGELVYLTGLWARRNGGPVSNFRSLEGLPGFYQGKLQKEGPLIGGINSKAF